MGGGAEMFGRAGPNAAESITYLAARAGILSQIPTLHSFGLRWKSTFPKLPQKASQGVAFVSSASPGLYQAPTCLQGWTRAIINMLPVEADTFWAK